MNVTKDQLLAVPGNFTWSFGQEFFIETSLGNYVWNDPDYGGDNTMKRFEGEYSDWIEEAGIPYGRDKGVKFISTYCGDTWSLV